MAGVAAVPRLADAEAVHGPDGQRALPHNDVKSGYEVGNRRWFVRQSWLCSFVMSPRSSADLVACAVGLPPALKIAQATVSRCIHLSVNENPPVAKKHRYAVSADRAPSSDAAYRPGVAIPLSRLEASAVA